MKAFVGLVSSNKLALSLTDKEQANLVPQELRQGSQFTGKGSAISIGTYDPTNSRESLMDFVFRRSAGTDIAALLVENKLALPLDDLSPAILIGRVVLDYSTAALMRTSIEAAFNRTLRNLLKIHALTSDEKHLEVLLLPKRNFVASDLGDLLSLGKTAGASNDLFEAIVAKLARLRRRKKPRRKNTDPEQKKYLVDDRKVLFEYGYENHSRYETGNPHTKSCILAARYRLGAKIPHEYRHFNMTKENGSDTWIDGHFPDCHNDSKLVRGTHINIFANDYH